MPAFQDGFEDFQVIITDRAVLHLRAAAMFYSREPQYPSGEGRAIIDNFL
jgi:hypothetical protein